MIYQGHGLGDKAIATLKKTLYLDPTFVLAHYALANLQLQQGEKERGRRSLRNVQRLLAREAKDTLLPEADGMTAGQLLDLVKTAMVDGG